MEIDRVMPAPTAGHVDLLERIGAALDHPGRSVCRRHRRLPRDRDIAPSGGGIGGGLEPEAAVIAGGQDPAGDGRYSSGEAIDRQVDVAGEPAAPQGTDVDRGGQTGGEKGLVGVDFEDEGGRGGPDPQGVGEPRAAAAMEVADLDEVGAVGRGGKAFDVRVGGEDALVGGIVGLGEEPAVGRQHPQLGIEIRAQPARVNLERKRLPRLGREGEAIGLPGAVDVAADDRRADSRRCSGRRVRSVGSLRQRQRCHRLDGDRIGGDEDPDPPERPPLKHRRDPSDAGRRVGG